MIHENDGPSVGSYPWTLIMALDVTAHDWLMWTPPGVNVIPIPIQEWTWSFTASAFWDNVINDWVVKGTLRTPTFEGVDTNIFPKWTKRVVNPS